jgi:hypothetical protein
MSHFSATRTLSDFPLLIGEMLRRGNLRSRRQARRRTLIRKIKPSEFRRPRQTKNSFLDVRKTALANRTDEVPDELALIQSERISTQWTNELRKNIRVYPTCNILKANLESRPVHANSCLRILYQGLEFESNRGTFGRCSYKDSRDIGKRREPAEEKTC